MTNFERTLFSSLLLLTLGAVSCSDDEDGGDGPAPSPEETGQPCSVASDCFEDLVEGGSLRGEALCITRVEDGYCTHTCEADTDCCAVEGECITDLPQVCSPFESMGAKYCFLSCEDEAIRAHEPALVDGGVVDANGYCQRWAHPAFICRSSGGGSENRKVCVPGGGGVDSGL